MPRNPPPHPPHLTEQKQSHESLGIQRCGEGARRFQFVVASVSTQGLCVVRLLISAHLLSSPGEVTGRYLQIIVSWCRLDPLTFVNAPIKQRNISVHKD